MGVGRNLVAVLEAKTHADMKLNQWQLKTTLCWGIQTNSIAILQIHIQFNPTFDGRFETSPIPWQSLPWQPSHAATHSKTPPVAMPPLHDVSSQTIPMSLPQSISLQFAPPSANCSHSHNHWNWDLKVLWHFVRIRWGLEGIWFQF